MCHYKGVRIAVTHQSKKRKQWKTKKNEEWKTASMTLRECVCLHKSWRVLLRGDHAANNPTPCLCAFHWRFASCRYQALLTGPQNKLRGSSLAASEDTNIEQEVLGKWPDHPCARSSPTMSGFYNKHRAQPGPMAFFHCSTRCLYFWVSLPILIFLKLVASSSTAPDIRERLFIFCPAWLSTARRRWISSATGL